MSNAHQLIGWAAGALAIALVAGASLSWWTARRSGGRADRRFLVDRLVLVTVGVIGLAGVLGLAVLATGGRPSDPLHLLYGVAALVTVPLGWALGSRRTADGERRDRRRRDAWIAAAATVALAIGVRLVMTA